MLSSDGKSRQPVPEQPDAAMEPGPASEQPDAIGRQNPASEQPDAIGRQNPASGQPDAIGRQNPASGQPDAGRRRGALSGLVLPSLLLISVVTCVLLLLDYALYPCTYVRSDIHSITTRTYDDVYVGTSHGKMDIDPAVMEEVSGRTGHNACGGGEYPADVLYLVRLMVETGHKPRRVIYEIAPAYFAGEKEEGNNYLLFYHEYPVGRVKLSYFWHLLRKCDFRTWFFPWYEYDLSYELSNLGRTLSDKWNRVYGAEQFRTEAQAYQDSGFIARYAVDTSVLTTEGLSVPETGQIRADNLDYLRELIRLCREEGIELMAVTTPLPLPYLQAYAAQFQQLWPVFEAFFEEEQVTWLNFNDEAHFNLFTHDIAAFTDMDGHMNSDAAAAFSRVLSRELS